jgi:purine-nucleoside phosphorylase
MAPTPHIEAEPGEIAETVIMPGDPLRAKFIAEAFLSGARRFNAVRGMLGYTGLYKGARVSVQGSGMGVPSMGIYSYELFQFYGVETIIRVGTAGGVGPGVNLRDVVIAMGAGTDSNFGAQFGLGGVFAPLADFALLESAVSIARRKELNFHVGGVLTTDVFYKPDDGGMVRWRDMGVLAVEMEAAGLYMNAARLNKKALCVLTVSDLIFERAAVSSAERETAFTDMAEIALETAAGAGPARFRNTPGDPGAAH